jgi:Arc/MetJ-type ribon-helix-helix transcriptional regulator
MSGMKLSVSLPDEDVNFLDKCVAQGGTSSRSSVIHQAIGLLRTASMEDAYAAAFQEWGASGDAELWESTASDGMMDASR